MGAPLDTLPQIESHLRALKRDWLQIELEGLGGSDENRNKEDDIVEDFYASEQRKAAVESELEQTAKELKDLQDRKLNAEQAVREEVQKMLDITEKEASLEQNFTDTDPDECLNALKATCNEREGELQALYKQIDDAEKDDQEVKEALRELQQRAPNTIPVIIKEKDEVLRSMEEAWRQEKRRLLQRVSELEKEQRQLSWHLNRGSYIKQLPKDPRLQGQFGTNGKVEYTDSRLKIWEDRLVQDHLESYTNSEDFKLQKIQVANALEKVRAQFEDPPADKKNIKEGTRPWLDGKIAALKAQVGREDKICKELVNENAHLKNLKKETEEKIKDMRRCNYQLLDTYSRQQNQQPAVLEAKAKAKAIEARKPQRK